MMLIKTKEELEQYYTTVDAWVSKKNPGRKFEILRSSEKAEDGSTYLSLAVVWLDGKGPLMLDGGE